MTISLDKLGRFITVTDDDAIDQEKPRFVRIRPRVDGWYILHVVSGGGDFQVYSDGVLLTPKGP